MQGAVIVRFDEAGELSYHAFGDVRLFIVDERAPHDRVYEYLDRPPLEQFREIIPHGSEIGSRTSSTRSMALRADRKRAELAGLYIATERQHARSARRYLALEPVSSL